MYDLIKLMFTDLRERAISLQFCCLHLQNVDNWIEHANDGSMAT